MDRYRADIKAIHSLLNRYQQAHREKNWDAVRACHDETYKSEMSAHLAPPKHDC